MNATEALPPVNPGEQLFTVTVTHCYVIEESRICELLICAWEGGSNYWAKAEGNPWQSCQSPDGRPMRLNLPITVLDYEDGCDENAQPSRLTLDLPAIKRGLDLLAHRGDDWKNFIDSNEDAETGDTFLQLCLFGEVIYG